MKSKFQKLRIRQLDDKLAEMSIKEAFIPANGWVKEVRTTLGMTHSQLGKRLNVSAPTVANYEKNEAAGKINLQTLKKAAEAMNCKLVYAIIPNESFKKTIEDQTLKVAGSIFKNATHSMKLEKQSVNEKENVDQYRELIEEVSSKMKKRIWDYEL